MNKSVLCYTCEKKGKVSIYYRDEQNVHKVAFYVCKYCMYFSGFIDTWKRKPRRIMPYYDDIAPLIKMLLKKKIMITSMKKTQYNVCIRCKKDDYTRLFIRNRDKNSYVFTGYVCKNCKTCFFINTRSLKFGTAPKSLGWFPVAVAEDEEKPIEDENIIVKKTDIPELKKAKISFRYNN